LWSKIWTKRKLVVVARFLAPATHSLPVAEVAQTVPAVGVVEAVGVVAVGVVAVGAVEVEAVGVGAVEVEAGRTVGKVETVACIVTEMSVPVLVAFQAQKVMMQTSLVTYLSPSVVSV
jgi:hypothetical protein